MDHLLARKPQKKVTTTLDIDDWKYCKKHQIKYAHAIRAFVRDHRVNSDDENAEPSTREMRKKLDLLIEKRDTWLEAIREIMSPEQFDKFLGKI